MYQALYRKWRPRTFDDVVGQEHISETLKRQVAAGRLSHAYLFVGTRGTGKTTCAKILSRAINCREEQNGNPCNKCPSCLGIDNGSIMDVLELDAASNNGVDNVRALREEAVFTPVDVKKRVYIIDEVHMLSGAAFNALLKILEEPPEHLVFILATTEIHKVPATILSRCQRFTFKRILPEHIKERLMAVAGREGLDLTEDAAALLARLADGSLRDALSLLDQCASGDRIDYDRVLSAIGLAGGGEIISILTAVSAGDAAGALKVLDRLYDAGKVMASVLEELMDLIRDVLLVALIPGGGTKLLTGGFELSVLEDFKARFSAAELMESMDVLLEALQDITKNSGGRRIVELSLLRLCRRGRGGSAEKVAAEQVRRTEPATPEIMPPVPSMPENTPPGKAAPAAKAPMNDMEPPKLDQPVPAEPAVSEEANAPAEAPVSVAMDDTPAAVPAAPPGAWDDILQAVRPKIDGAANAALNESTVKIGEKTVIIGTKNLFAQSAVNDPAVKSVIEETAAAVLNQRLEVRVVIDDSPGADTGGGTRGTSMAGGGNRLDDISKKFPGFIVEE